jgi:adenylate cyclase
VCFADLVGFTRLGDRVAPAELGGAARRLTDMAVEAARPPVRLVKMIGDAALLVAPEPAPLVEAALALAADAERAGDAMPSLRVGVAHGMAVADGGDWYGAPLNLASRVSDVARPGSVLATSEVRDALASSPAPAFAWSFAGRRRLRGVRAEVSLYRVRAQ